jgi:DNA-binding transcriptional ArsR family regulator
MAIDQLHTEPVSARPPRRFSRPRAKPAVGDELAEIVAQRFAALGDPSRVKIVEHLRLAGEQSVKDVAGALGLPHPNISRHLNVLFAASVVTRRKAGNRATYSLDSPGVMDLLDRMHAEIEEEARRIAAAAPLAALPDYP